MEKLYREFKEEVNKLMEENQIKVKKNNRRKSIRVLIKAKKSIKRRIRTEGSRLDREEKYMLIARMNNIEEAIKNEGQKQFQQKIEKVVDRGMKKQDTLGGKEEKEGTETRIRC